MSKSVQLPDFDKVAEKIIESGQRKLAAAARSLNESGEQIMTTSKEVYCPLLTGALKSSGMVEVEQEADSVTMTLGYGGPSAPYAVHVHEIDNNYNNGKQWKYLETPFNEGLSELMRKLKDDVERA